VAAFWAYEGRAGEPAWFPPWTCPGGWRALPDGSCVPTTNPSCAADEPPLPDGTCVPVGAARCPATEFAPIPEDAVGARVVYVRAGAPADAAGTLTEPVGDVARAIERAGDGGVVLMAAGTYPVTTTLRGRRRVVGVCAARVTLRRASSDMNDGVLRAQGEGASLAIEGVTIDAVVRHLLAQDGAHIAGRGLVLRGGNDLAVEINSTVELRDAWVVSRPTREWGPGDGGVFVGQGGRLALRNVAAQGGWRVYGRGEGEPTFALDNAALRDFRYGVDVRATAVTARASSIDGVPAPVFYLDRALTIDGLSITRAGGSQSPFLDVILGAEGARFDLRRVRIEHGGSPGIRVVGERSRAVLQDVSIVPAGGPTGLCIQAEQLTTLEASRLRLDGCAGIGVSGQAGATVTVEDALIRDLRLNPQGYFGVGLAQLLAGQLTARRVRIEGASLTGVGAVSLPLATLRRVPWETLWPQGRRFSEDPTRMTLEDIAIAGANPDPRYPATAIVAAAGTALTARRVAVTRQRGIGVAAVDDGFNREAVLGALMRSFGLLPAQVGLAVAILGPNLDGASSLTIDGLYTSRVDPWRVLLDLQNPAAQPEYRAAWGAYASPGATLTLRDATLDGEGGTERAVVSGGAVSLERAVVSRHRGCALATLGSVMDATLLTHDVTSRGNGGDGICRDPALPRVHLPVSSN